MLIDFFTYSFLTRALLVGIFLSLCAALLGVSMVLKRYAMIGDGLSHVGFGALAIAAVTNAAPLAVALPVVIVAAFLLMLLNENGKLKGDSAIALLSSGALAVGILAVSVQGGMNVEIDNYLFGSIVALDRGDAILSVALSVAVLLLYLLFFPRIFAVTFDESFAKATGTHTRIWNLLLSVLTSVTVVLGMRMLGALLISSLIIFPSLTAMRVFRTYRSVVICSMVLSVTDFLLGLVACYLLGTPVGATIVVVHLITFALFAGIGMLRDRLGKRNAP